jgi:hypothetical protein
VSRHRSKVKVELSPAVKERLRKAYLDDTIILRDIGRRFGMGEQKVIEYATREGWPMRKKSREQRVEA